MPTHRRHTALALARAVLAGRPDAAGIAARMRACLAAPATPWQTALAERCAAMPGEIWRRQTVRSLANLIERDPGFLQAWASAPRPQARRYILRLLTRMNPLPLGLHDTHVPSWPNSAELAHSLRITTAGLWRLTRSASWQRRAPLVQQHYHYHLIPKRSGEWRLLEVPEPYLMQLQRRLLHGLLDNVAPHEAAAGFTRGRSVIDHAHAHVGRPVVLKFDLRDFFASVRASRVHALFVTLGYPETVARELTALCTTATPEPVLRRLREDGTWSWERSQRWRDAHLPQGAPTSAALANLCAFRLDLRLSGLADALQARYTRYADDIVLSGDRNLRQAALRIEAWVGRIAREEGFALNHRKTRCQAAGGRQTVCGVVVNQRTNLPRAKFERLKAMLYRCVVNGPSIENREQLLHWRQHLEGRVVWAMQVNSAKAHRLKELLARIDWSR